MGDLPLETANSPDEPVDYALTADSEYQEWARGNIGLDALIALPPFTANDGSLLPLNAVAI